MENKTIYWLVDGRHHDLVDRYGISISLVVSSFRSFPHSWLITGIAIILTLLELLNTYPSGALEFAPCFYWGSWYSIFVLCVYFVDLCLFLWPFSFLITPLATSEFPSNATSVNVYVWRVKALICIWTVKYWRYRRRLCKKASCTEVVTAYLGYVTFCVFV